MSIWEIISALALIVLGVFLIGWSHPTLQVIVVFLGIFLLLESLAILIPSMRLGGVLGGVGDTMAVLGAILGVLVLVKPDLTLAVIAVIVGIWAVITGLILVFIPVPRYRWMNVLAGLVLAGIGVWFIVDHGAAITTMGVLAGILVLALGVLHIASGITLRKASDNLEIDAR